MRVYNEEKQFFFLRPHFITQVIKYKKMKSIKLIFPKSLKYSQIGMVRILKHRIYNLILSFSFSTGFKNLF